VSLSISSAPTPKWQAHGCGTVRDIAGERSQTEPTTPQDPVQAARLLAKEAAAVIRSPTGLDDIFFDD
jgi:hypothetical protein